MSRSPGRPIALVGYMGSGKSTVAVAVARLLGWSAVDLDQLIEERAQMTIAEMFGSQGEAGFRRLEAEMLAGVLEGNVVLALGGGAVVDDRSWQLVKERSVSVWLEVPLEELWARVGSAPGRPLAGDRGSFEQVYRGRRDRYADADHRVDATRAPAEIAEEVARLCAG